MVDKVTGKKDNCLVWPVCLKMKNWPDKLTVTNINCFAACSCYVTMQIVFDFGVKNCETTE